MTVFAWRSCACIVAVLASFAAAAPAHALTQQEIDWCAGRGDPASLDIRMNACRAALQSGRWSGNNLAWIFANFCDIYIRKGEHDNAIAECRRTIEMAPNHPNAHYNLGVAYSDKGDYTSALAAYEQALRVNPNDAEAYTNRGYVHEKLGNQALGVADYRMGCKLGNQVGCENLRRLGLTP